MIMGMGSRRRRDVPGEAPVGPASTVSDVIRDLVGHGWTIDDIAATLNTTTDHLEGLLARDVPSAAVALAAQRGQCQGRSHQ